MYAALYIEMVKVCLILQLSNIEIMYMYGCSMIKHLHILPSLHVTLWANIFRAAGLVKVHQHLPWHDPDYHIVLTSPHQTTLGSAITKITSWAELWDGLPPLLCHKCFGACQAEKCGTSGHSWYKTVHMQIHLMYGNSYKMIKCSKVKWSEVNWSGIKWLSRHPV
jgi:hypothetical protein